MSSHDVAHFKLPEEIRGISVSLWFVTIVPDLDMGESVSLKFAVLVYTLNGYIATMKFCDYFVPGTGRCVPLRKSSRTS